MQPVPVAGVGRRDAPLPPEPASDTVALREHERVAGRAGNWRRVRAVECVMNMEAPPVIRPRKVYEQAAWSLFWLVVAACSVAAASFLIWIYVTVDRFGKHL